MMWIRVVVTLLAALTLAAVAHADSETVTHADGLTADTTADGRVAIELDGDIWIVPSTGGLATPATRGLDAVRHPRWSADGSSIVLEAVGDGPTGLRVYDLEAAKVTNLSGDGVADVDPAWHPDGERIVFSSDRKGSGLDLWEIDLPTGLQWQLSHRAGDETEAAWSDDGRDLVYIHYVSGQWSLILRRYGEPEETLVSASEPLAAPSWRPDGSLITFLRDTASGRVIDMVILSNPRLVRRYAVGEAFERAPVSWRDKDNMVYTADGRIRQRRFDDWTSTALPFRAELTRRQAQQAPPVRRALPRIDEPRGRLIIHAARLFDGVASGYHYNKDIVIDGGRILSVEEHEERTGVAVINLGDLAILPGYIDSNASLPNSVSPAFGASLLTTGVTTLVAQIGDPDALNVRWSAKDSPGPRVLGATKWRSNPAAAIADATTPGLDELLASRQATLFAPIATVARRYAPHSVTSTGTTALQLGSRENGLPPGLALHAEFRARAAAGIKPERILRAAGVNAAAALGADPFLGRVAVGAVADLVFVDGDPLANINDALNVVAVVRNGRFYSAIGLVELAGTVAIVE